jgi:hypothetical protein
VIGCIHGKVKSAQALYGKDVALGKERDGLLDGVGAVNPVSGLVMKEYGRTALPAGIGLGMEPAVFRIVILPLTGRTHAKGVHGRDRPVIGDVFNDGIPRSAIRTVDKRVLEPSVFRIFQLLQTVHAYTDIRRYEGGAFMRCKAHLDLETLFIFEGNFRPFDRGDMGKGRTFKDNLIKKATNVFPGSLDFHVHALRCV